MNSLRILICINALGSGGAEVLVASLAREFVSRHRVMLVTYAGCLDKRGEKLKKELLDSGVIYRDLGARTFWEKIALPYKLGVIIKKEFNPDIVHAHLQPMVTACSIARLFLNDWNKRKYIWTLHDARRVRKNLSWFLNERAYDAAVGCAEPVTQRLIESYSGKKIINIDNGINLPIVRTLKKNKDSTFKAVLVGRFTELPDGLTKGQDYVIEKLAQYPLKNFQVNFVGGGEPLENERRRAKELGLEGRSVFYLGVVADVYQELARADFYLSASIVEGMPIAVLEAILSGLPAILPDIPEFKKFSSKSVYLYDRESSQGMVDAIKSFIDGYDEVSAAAIESAMKMRRSYSIETCAENHERLYASLVNG